MSSDYPHLRTYYGYICIFCHHRSEFIGKCPKDNADLIESFWTERLCIERIFFCGTVLTIAGVLTALTVRYAVAERVFANLLVTTIWLVFVYGFGYKLFRVGTFNERFLYEVPAYAFHSFSWRRYFSEFGRFGAITLGVILFFILAYGLTMGIADYFFD